MCLNSKIYYNILCWIYVAQTVLMIQPFLLIYSVVNFIMKDTWLEPQKRNQFVFLHYFLPSGEKFECFLWRSCLRRLTYIYMAMLKMSIIVHGKEIWSVHLRAVSPRCAGFNVRNIVVYCLPIWPSNLMFAGSSMRSRLCVKTLCKLCARTCLCCQAVWFGTRVG